MDLVEEIYRDEVYGQTTQLRRAAVSIPSNIAEGRRREYLKEYLQLLSIAQGSVAELRTQLEIAGRLKYLSEEQMNSVLEQADAVGRQLNARNWLVGHK